MVILFVKSGRNKQEKQKISFFCIGEKKETRALARVRKTDPWFGKSVLYGMSYRTTQYQNEF